MKTKRIKHKHSLDGIHTLYTDKRGKLKFKADLYQCKGYSVSDPPSLHGEVIVTAGKHILYHQDSGTLKDWRDNARQMYYFYGSLIKFLDDVEKRAFNK